MVEGAVAHVGVGTKTMKKALAFFITNEEKHCEPLSVMDHPPQLADILANLGESVGGPSAERLAQQATCLNCDPPSALERGRHLQSSQQFGQHYRARVRPMDNCIFPNREQSLDGS